MYLPAWPRGRPRFLWLQITCVPSRLTYVLKAYPICPYRAEYLTSSCFLALRLYHALSSYIHIYHCCYCYKIPLKRTNPPKGARRHLPLVHTFPSKNAKRIPKKRKPMGHQRSILEYKPTEITETLTRGHKRLMPGGKTPIAFPETPNQGTQTDHRRRKNACRNNGEPSQGTRTVHPQRRNAF